MFRLDSNVGELGKNEISSKLGRVDFGVGCSCSVYFELGHVGVELDCVILLWFN